jgi:putative MATE family efflux protein
VKMACWAQHADFRFGVKAGRCPARRRVAGLGSRRRYLSDAPFCGMVSFMRSKAGSMTPRPKLTSGPVASTLMRLTAPMLLAMLGMVGFNIADTFFIGQLGTEPLAAISFTFPVVFVIGSIAMGLGIGAGSVIARAIGGGDTDRVRRLTTDALVLVFVVVLVVASLGVVTVTPLFTALGAEPQLVVLIAEYMEIWYLGVPFVVIPMVGNGAIRATGDTRTPATIMLLAMVINLVLDPLLIFGLGPIPAMGLRGAALATVGSRALTLVAALYILARRERMLSFERPALAEVLASWRSILHIGLPAALTNLIMPASLALVTRLVASFGVAAVAGFGVATRLEMIPIMFIHALGSVLVPFVGQNSGAGEVERIKSAVRFSHVVALGVGAVAVAVFWLAGASIARLFNDDPEVVKTVVLYGNLVGLGWGLQGVATLTSAIFNALNRPLPSGALSLLRMAVLYVPLAWVLSRWFGLEGIFVAGLIASVTTGGLAIWWVRAVVGRLSNDTIVTASVD